MMKKKTVIVLVAASLLALLLPGRASADLPLVCTQNNPNDPANGEVLGAGTREHRQLQQELFIPQHGNLCPETVGKVQFTEAPDDVTIEAYGLRDIHIAGLNQPLSTVDYATILGVLTFPLMIDGVVLTANIPCSAAGTNTLKLDPVSLSAIYSGVVVRWNDPVLLQRNPWLQNCGTLIKVSVRQDEAWSSYLLKDYLSKRNPLFTPLKERGRLGEWPRTLFPACGGSSESHMASCALVSGSISYMRYATAVANSLTPVELSNGSDQDPLASAADPYPNPNRQPGDLWPSGCQDALLVASPPINADYVQKAAKSPHTSVAGSQLDWSTFSMTYNSRGYALCGMGLIQTFASFGSTNSEASHNAWVDHLRLMWSDDMQERLKDYGYAPLPDAHQNIVLSSLPGPQ